jgi:hypothetical protein
MIIHLKAVGDDLYFTVEDVLASKEALPPTLVAKDDLVYPEVTTDPVNLRGHIKWDSVTKKDGSGKCRWGHADLTLVDEGIVYRVTATSASQGKLPCR